MDNYLFENIFFLIFYYNIHMNIITLITIMIYAIKAIKEKSKIRSFATKIMKILIALVFFSLYLVLQSIALEGLFEGVTGLLLINQGTDAYRSYMDNFVSINTSNILLYLVFLFILYKTRSTLKAFIVGFVLLLFPFFQDMAFSIANELFFFERVNTIILSFLGIILVRQIYQERYLIKKFILSMDNITPRYCFIPVFGIPIVFVKYILEEKINIISLSVLIGTFCITYIFQFILMLNLMSSEYLFYAIVPYIFFIIGPFTIIVTMFVVLDFDKKNKTKLESERSENE